MEAAKVGAKRSRTAGGGTAAPVERKEVERRRRNDMKLLCLKLGSLVPKEHRSRMTQLGSLDDAAAYIKKLKERVDEMQRRRRSSAAAQPMGTSGGGGSAELVEGDEEEPVVEVRYHDESSLLDVVLVCGAAGSFRFHEVIAVLDEEGAEILNASHFLVDAGHKIFCSIHARAFSSRIGVEVARISERLGALLRQ